MSAASADVSDAPDLTRSRRIVLAHGGGGQLTDDLLEASVMPRLGNDVLDAAILPSVEGHRLAMSIDGYVVQPWRFPGGDIGQLAVSGTVNDLSVSGAVPAGLALGLILSEGLATSDLEAIMDSIAQTARHAGIHVVTGDTKVVGRGQADGIYITTAGVGHVPPGRALGPDQVRPDDVLVVSGPIGEHGLAVMLAREMPEVQSVVRSDVAPLNGLIERMLETTGDALAFMRDPTRSGLAGVAADLARQSGFHVTLDETAIPVRPEARHAADMLGLDPLEVANEGKVVAVARPEAAQDLVDAMRSHPDGSGAVVIGRVEPERDGICELHTTIGGRRVLQKPYGEQLPRIC